MYLDLISAEINWKFVPIIFPGRKSGDDDGGEKKSAASIFLRFLLD